MRRRHGPVRCARAGRGSDRDRTRGADCSSALQRGLLAAAGDDVIGGGHRVGIERRRREQLVAHAVDEVAAEHGASLRRVHVHDHRPFGVPAGCDAMNAVVDRLAAGELEVEQPQRAARVQPVDHVLDVLGRVRRPGQSRHRVFELAPVDHRGGRHREEVGLARVVDVQVRVQHVAHVARLDAVQRELAARRAARAARHPRRCRRAASGCRGGESRCRSPWRRCRASAASPAPARARGRCRWRCRSCGGG